MQNEPQVYYQVCISKEAAATDSSRITHLHARIWFSKSHSLAARKTYIWSTTKDSMFKEALRQRGGEMDEDGNNPFPPLSFCIIPQHAKCTTTQGFLGFPHNFYPLPLLTILPQWLWFCHIADGCSNSCCSTQWQWLKLLHSSGLHLALTFQRQCAGWGSRKKKMGGGAPNVPLCHPANIPPCTNLKTQSYAGLLTRKSHHIQM